MFTGIVQTLGTVRSIRSGSAGYHLVLEAPDLPRPLADGCSISVSGVCLTVTRSDPRLIEFDVVPETVSRSTLGDSRPGDMVNLESALRAGDPMDGHIVQGHVDGVATVRDVREDGGGYLMQFDIDTDLIHFIVQKGSVTIDGVSLTVARVDDNGFAVALIPTTLEHTTLGRRRPGDKVNVETDIVARTIVSYLQRRSTATSEDPVTLDMLRENGWP